MKVKNLEIGIKIGLKERKFTNLILNNYIELFANSLLEFKSKQLQACAINITKQNINIDENSTTMQYDTVKLNRDFQEVLTENTIINKYTFTDEDGVELFPSLNEFSGQTIKQIGFGIYDYETSTFKMYAYLDISKYNIVIQEGQPIVISRIDKIVSDMKFWSNSKDIVAPYHLTADAIHLIQGMEYIRVLPKLYSAGFGILPYKFIKEVLAEDLTIEETAFGELTISGLGNNFAKDDLFPSPNLYPRPDLYPREATANLLIYKFKMYYEIYEDPMEPETTLVDTGKYYVQYKELTNFGVIDSIKIKYERG